MAFQIYFLQKCASVIYDQYSKLLKFITFIDTVGSVHFTKLFNAYCLYHITLLSLKKVFI